MPNPVEVPEVEVAVVLVRCGKQILAVYNSHWGAFTLPMTKRRIWQDPSIPPAYREEEWINAAARAAAENLGRTITGLMPLPAEIPPYQQGDRTGEWKRYSFRVFELAMQPPKELAAGVVGEWLIADQLLDSDRRPISQTARHIIEALGAAGSLP